jgi:hypothetical protein
MHFSLYLPAQAEERAVPLLIWLSGLTCTDENFTHKAGATPAGCRPLHQRDKVLHDAAAAGVFLQIRARVEQRRQLTG